MLASAVSLGRINEPPGHGLRNNYGTARGLAVRQGAVIQRTSAVTTEIPADTRACLSCFCPRAADKAMYLCLCPPPSLTAPPPPCACSAPPRAPSTQTWPVAAERHNYTFLALLMAGYLKPRPRWPEEDLGWPEKRCQRTAIELVPSWRGLAKLSVAWGHTVSLAAGHSPASRLDLTPTVRIFPLKGQAERL